MTIARRLIILLAVPLLILVGLGIFVRVQLNRIEVGAGSWPRPRSGVSRRWATSPGASPRLRVNVRSYLLADDKAEQAGQRRSLTRTRRSWPACSTSTPTP